MNINYFLTNEAVLNRAAFFVSSGDTNETDKMHLRGLFCSSHGIRHRK